MIRRPRPYRALLPLISALVAIGVGLSIITVLTHAISIASWVPEVAIIVALGVGVDYALFIVSRHRNGLLADQTPEDAAVTALNTSGRAVLLAGLTVCVALLGLFALQISSLYGVAVAVALVVGLTMVASLTLLPAMLGFLCPKVFPTTGPQDAATTTVLDRLRAGVPQAEAGSTLAIHIGGTTAANQDYSQVTSSKLPQFVAVVVGLSFLLLAVVFRSLLIPLVASIMNILSFGIALGVMTAAFQFGWGKSLLGFGTAAPIEAWIPAMMFAILFGLSTDYEVFLISRIHEQWTLSGDNKRAVIRGQAETGRVITAASLIMILVFAAFILTGQEAIMQIGLGFAAAIFVDAYIIRTVLVPAVLHMLGRANWWLPGWLDRTLPRLHVEPAELTPAGLLRQPTAVGPREL